MKYIALILIVVIIGCKPDIKEKIDRLPEYDMEEIKNIIGSHESAVKNAAKLENIAVLEILDRSFDFGTIIQGEKVKHRFKIKNIGKSDLQFLDIKTSCGCTLAEKPKKALAPGNEDFIEVEFDSKGKIGEQLRKIAIFTNSLPNEDYVEMIGVVKKKS